MILDSYQQKAVETTEKRVLCVATPGSGKTRTIVERFNYMVSTLKIIPSNIVLLTFTRYAANEMKTRIGRSSGKAFLGTFHSFALRIIEMYGSCRGWQSSYLTILDEEECWMEEEQALKNSGIIDTKGKWNKTCAPYVWEKFRESKLTGGSGQKDLPEDVKAKLEVTWTTFYDRLRAENVLTYGTMILEALELVKDSTTGDKLRERFKHILVDEAQDSDATQWQLVEALKPETLFVVGDLDQSIYGFRGGRPDLFLKYSEGATVYQLPRSYRFGINIAEPANKLIKNNIERLDMAIQAIAENQGTVETVKNAEYSDVAGIIKKELVEHKPQEIAVLARRHATLDNLANCLESTDIPFTKLGGDSDITKRPEFRIIKGLLRMTVNERDNRAFIAVVPVLNLSNLDIWNLREKANNAGKSLTQIYKESNGDTIPKTVLECQAWLREHDTQHVYDMMFAYLNDIIFRESICDTQELVKYLSLSDIQDQLATVNETVTLCTAHTSKGLEWKVVIVLGMNSGEWPSPRSVRENKTEEERRLLYVAMTRSEKKLYLISKVPEHQKDGQSMFFDEIGSLDLKLTAMEEDNLKMR